MRGCFWFGDLSDTLRSMKRFHWAFWACWCIGCAPSIGQVADRSFPDPAAAPDASALMSALREDAIVGPVLFAPDEAFGTHRAQLLIGVVDSSLDPPRLVRAGQAVDRAYFYPASTVKLFAAVGALLRIQELQSSGIPADADTPLTFHPMFEGEALESSDPSNRDTGLITVRHEIRKLFVVSDNRAFNRLLGFVGRADLNRMMHDAGLGSVRIRHRLSVGYSAEQNRRMPRIDLDLGDGRVHTIRERVDPPADETTGVPMLDVGDAEMVAGERRERPKSFARSNRVSLRDLQDAVVMVVRPDVDLGKPGFPLSDEHRALLVEAMGMLPRESGNPRYDPDAYPDEWAKFMLPGVRRALPSRAVRIYNKIGLAYGFTTTTSGISIDGRPPALFIAGTLYTNANGTLNDNVYEYDTVAFPYWSAVGETVVRASSGRTDHNATEKSGVLHE